jgi:hypothetical protein
MSSILLRIAGLMRSIAIPSRNHQTDNLLNPNKAQGEENGAPLSVRIARGKPYFWKVCSKILKASDSLLLDKPSQVNKNRLE